MGTCYLLHFETPIAPGRHTCQHYIGWSNRRLRERIADHRKGYGARLTQVAKERGISFIVVRTWPNTTRRDERRLKNRKDVPKRLCPICTGKKMKGYLRRYNG